MTKQGENDILTDFHNNNETTNAFKLNFQTEIA